MSLGLLSFCPAVPRSALLAGSAVRPRLSVGCAVMLGGSQAVRLGDGQVGERRSQGGSGTSRRSRAVVCLLAAVVLAVLAVLSAAPAHAVVRGDILGCNNDDAPLPASPQGPASMAVRVTKAPADADPFTDPQVSIESVYGTTPQFFTYDNGCTGQFMAGAGTALANIVVEVTGLLPNWTHALLHSVLAPGSWLHDLERPVVAALAATRSGVWTPWLPVVVLAVAVVVFLRARHGRLAGSVSAAAWALLVLVVASWVMNYPVAAVHGVDAGVQEATKLIATGFDGRHHARDESADAVMDHQMDQVVRSTQYRTWLTGTFGDPESGTAKTYGPRLFDATHFTWDEHAAYAKDPTGKGKKIVEAKAAAFKQIAEKVKSDDPRAYEYLQGGKWSQRIVAALLNGVMVLVVCGFLLVAGVSILLAYALIRLLVPFAPVAGVLFMVDHTRDLAVGMLKKVVGPLVMGPVCLLLGLVLLRFDTAILAASTWFPVKLGVLGCLAVVAWMLARPDAYSLGLLRRGVGYGVGLLGALRREHREVHHEPVIRRLEAGPTATALPRAGGPSRAGRAYMPGVDDRPALGFSPPPPSVAPPPIALPAGPTDTPVRALTTPASATPVKPQYGWPIGPHPLIRASEKYPPPTVTQTIATKPLGPRTRFPPKGLDLEPHTAYEVPSRGTYYTDDTSEVVHVEALPGTTGNLNWDLNFPAPGVTYVVSDRFRYDTDRETRTVRSIDVQVARGDAPRSPSIQSSVGKAAGPGYDGGHLQQNAHAGIPERINIVAQLQEMNRSGTTEFGSIPNSFYKFEAELRDMVSSGRNVSVDLRIRYPKDSDSRTPTMISAVYTVDGGPPRRRNFENVRDE